MSKAKRIFWIVLCVILALVIVLPLVWHYIISPLYVREFDLEDYSYFLEEYSSDEVVGAVTNAREARAKGVAILEEVYGKDKIRGQVPFIVSYDQEADAWLISGSTPLIPFLLGGSAQIIINGADGDVLAVWHYR